MSSTIENFDFVGNLPTVIATDEHYKAKWAALAPQFKKIAELTKLTDYRQNLDDLSDDILLHIAYEYRVTGYEAAVGKSERISLIENAIRIWRKKGTVASIRSLLTSAGYGDAVIQEGIETKYNGTAKHNGSYVHGYDPTNWAKWRIVFQSPLSLVQAEELKALLEETAPKRCKLVGMYFDKSIKHDGSIKHDRTYSYGVISWQI